MTYSSKYTDTTSYNEGFRDYLNGNLTKLALDMKEAGLDVVVGAGYVFQFEPTPAPTLRPTQRPSSAPSSLPSLRPSSVPSLLHSDHPSIVPSLEPSYQPSSEPSSIPSVFPSDIPSVTHSDVPSTVPSVFPSSAPSGIPSTLPSTTPSHVPSAIPSNLPSLKPTAKKRIISLTEPTNMNNNDDTNIQLIAGSTGGVALAAIVIGFVLFKRRKQKKSLEKPTPGSGPLQSTKHENRTANVTTGWSNDMQESALTMSKSMIAPNGSNAEQAPIGKLSAEVSDDEWTNPDISDDSMDYMHGVHGIFTQKEHDNTMYATDTIESNPSLVSMGTSMSSDSDPENDLTDNWGGSDGSAEIEASALCEMNDWLKRSEGASLNQR